MLGLIAILRLPWEGMKGIEICQLLKVSGSVKTD